VGRLFRVLGAVWTAFWLPRMLLMISVMLVNSNQFYAGRFWNSTLKEATEKANELNGTSATQQRTLPSPLVGDLQNVSPTFSD